VSIRNANGESVDQDQTKIPDVPDAPTSPSASDVGTSRAFNNGSATVSFSAPATGGTPTSFTATSTPGSFTATASTSPITVTGLQSATSYTFGITGANSTGNGSASSSSAITATTVPQAPTIGTFTDGGTGNTGTLSFTAGATGGKSITGYKVSTDGTTYTTVSGTTSPLSLTGLSVGTYTFYLKATNANGDSAASSGVSGTVIAPLAFDSIQTITVGAGGVASVTFSSIPQTYTHLQIRMFSKDTQPGAASDSVSYKINGDTAANYANGSLTVNSNPQTYSTGGSSAYTYTQGTLGGYLTIPSTTPGITQLFAPTIMDIYDYTNTNKNKLIKNMFSYMSNYTTPNASAGIVTTSWNSTAAITSITILPNSSSFNFVQNCQFALYGIK
jgi:hypothetical protein